MDNSLINTLFVMTVCAAARLWSGAFTHDAVSALYIAGAHGGGRDVLALAAVHPFVYHDC